MNKALLLMAVFAAMVSAAAQYQLPNAGFEQWDGGNTSEPTHWNSFATSDGSYASLASSPHHYRRNGGRPGTAGSYYLTIYTKSIIGIKANGNMTTGRIHAGSMSAGSSDNYNYTQRSNSAHCQPFSGTPDSMYVWVSFYAASSSSEAQVSAILHGDNDFRAPNEENTPSKYCGKAVARFSRTTSSHTSMQWRQMRVPFSYSGTASAAYMLVNITTNKTPGAGDSNDSLSIDDIEFIYSSWLNTIEVAGVPIESFGKGRMDYTVHTDDTAAAVTWQTEADDATVSVSRQPVDDTSVLVTLTVTAEDGVSTHTYTVLLTTGIPEPTSGIANALTPTSTISVSPNPTSDRLTVVTDGEVTLCDLSGRLLRRFEVHGKAIIDLSDLPAGVYLLRRGASIRRIVRL